MDGFIALKCENRCKPFFGAGKFSFRMLELQLGVFLDVAYKSAEILTSQREDR